MHPKQAIRQRLAIWTLAQVLAVLLCVFGQGILAYVVAGIIAGYASYMAADSTNTIIDRLLGIIAVLWFIAGAVFLLWFLVDLFSLFKSSTF